MNRARLVMLQAFLVVWLATSFTGPATAARDQEPAKDQAIVFFDVSDMPARIDEPKLHKTDSGFVLKCAVANRSVEQWLGLRLILLVVERSGKLRSQITWNEASELASYSIKTFAFHPNITGDLGRTDQLFLGIDEVVGHETIWHAVEAEKALRGLLSWAA